MYQIYILFFIDPWVSIFKNYVIDTEELLTKCFEFDWQHSKISRFIKNEDEQ